MSIGPRPIHDITAQNLSEVPASRGSNPIKWIVIHYLGVANADNPNLYGGGYGGHYNITRDGTIYKAADPRTAVVWQCGGGIQGEGPGAHRYYGQCTNYNSIGIENGVCYDSDWYFTTETQESLVYLVSKLMDEYGIDIDHVIRHYDVTGKRCPAPYVANNRHNTSWTWDEFLLNLANYRNPQEDDDKVIKDIFKTARIKKMYAKPKYRTVKQCDFLNVRMAPDQSAPIHPYWGKLMPGNGVQEICKFEGGWSCVYIGAGAGTGTIGYVASSYLQ